MSEKTQKQMIQETHQGMFGVEGTEDNGLVGDVKEIKTTVKEQNGRISRNSRLIFIIVGILIAAGAVGGLEAAEVIRLIGG